MDDLLQVLGRKEGSASMAGSSSSDRLTEVEVGALVDHMIAELELEALAD